MKKRHGVFFGFAVLVIAAIFTVAGCGANGDPTSPGDDGIISGGNLITGKFTSQNGGSGDAVFTANYKSSANRNAARAVAGLAATEKELAGKIEDGDMILTLTGFHDTESNQFFLSAGSSFLVYEIGGTLSSGTMSNAKATVKIKDDGGKWTEVTVAVSNNSDDVEITGTASAQQEEGLPVAWFGRWYDDTNVTYCTLTGFNLIYEAHLDWLQMSFVNVKKLSDVKYQVITFTPEVIGGGGSGPTGGPTNGSEEPVTIPAAYSIKWLERTTEG